LFKIPKKFCKKEYWIFRFANSSALKFLNLESMLTAFYQITLTELKVMEFMNMIIQKLNYI